MSDKVISLASPPERSMSYEAFLSDWPEDVRAEWVAGEVIPLSPPSIPHQLIVNFLSLIMTYYAQRHALGTTVTSPAQMKTAPDLPGREPDIFFIRKENLGRLKHNYLEGAADLVVEVISPESRSRDRGEKFYEYEAGGVQEYWLIDPLRKQAEFYTLGKDGIYRLAPIEEGRYRSKVVAGLELSVAWLWQEPLPSIPSIIESW